MTTEKNLKVKIKEELESQKEIKRKYPTKLTNSRTSRVEK